MEDFEGKHIYRHPTNGIQFVPTERERWIKTAEQIYNKKFQEWVDELPKYYLTNPDPLFTFHLWNDGNLLDIYWEEFIHYVSSPQSIVVVKGQIPAPGVEPLFEMSFVNTPVWIHPYYPSFTYHEKTIIIRPLAKMREKLRSQNA